MSLSGGGRTLVRMLLVWGLVAGLCGGLAATGFAELAGERSIGHAIAFEQAHDRAAGVPAEPALVSRGVQRSVGLLVALGVYGVALGGLFALCFAAVHRRLGRVGPAATALALAAAAFVVVYLAPFVKYPANPPSIGDPATIGRRTQLYLAMIAISLLAALAAVRLQRPLAQRLGALLGTAASGGAYLLVVTAAGAALPGVNEVPRDFPATTLWSFRAASVGMQLVLWATIGLVFAVAVERRVFSARRVADDRDERDALPWAPAEVVREREPRCGELALAGLAAELQPALVRASAGRWRRPGGRRT